MKILELLAQIGEIGSSKHLHSSQNIPHPVRPELPAELCNSFEVLDIFFTVAVRLEGTETSIQALDLKPLSSQMSLEISLSFIGLVIAFLFAFREATVIIGLG